MPSPTGLPSSRRVARMLPSGRTIFATMCAAARRLEGSESFRLRKASHGLQDVRPPEAGKASTAASEEEPRRQARGSRLRLARELLETDLLHPPIGQLANQQLVLIATVDRIGQTKLFRKLPRRTEFA